MFCLFVLILKRFVKQISSRFGMKYFVMRLFQLSMQKCSTACVQSTFLNNDRRFFNGKKHFIFKPCLSRANPAAYLQCKVSNYSVFGIIIWHVDIFNSRNEVKFYGNCLLFYTLFHMLENY